MISPNDIVRHEPSGEEWVVCGINHETGYLIPCGYPFPSFGKISDCTLLQHMALPQTEKMREALIRAGYSTYLEKP